MAKYQVRMYDTDGICHSEETCFYFRYVKEIYTPYVYFECEFLGSSEQLPVTGRIEFFINDTLMHCGIVDSIELRRRSGQRTVHIKSKGFTSLLCQNQPEPGLMTDVTLSSVIQTFPDIPYITWENNLTENYVYIKDGATVWDAICGLSFKATGRYPYINGTNEVRMTPPASPKTITIGEENLLESGERHDFTRIISHIHMQDIQGGYNVYSKTNQSAVERNIIRHKQIPLDRQFLNNPDSALDYKLGYSMRGFVCSYIRYAGFNSEELFDRVKYSNMPYRTIHSVELLFDGGKEITTLRMYNDSFFE